ncbi:bifunctional phosphopantothenoylcysteine decarboxylase/phosphopantothenate--cysteine ligase CoaBC [Desulfolutivibrio sulfoxidireducens]|uniref:bifunctional phosphopantothenoylcysteine decarboxylase/phosphopantothenate--cysteine ligase CoaBC n=1 Tax=Desulfolutivibrio sulfoxidireducens TaxID=2773299 RepID=UPI00159E25B9|nr:bifunctional phosphopantothenoylcysteine decarboxylase/phosphopantothenate--cysteine ligase CoaBC [Desulfolutivibrio sulfoxidireducens]QLA14682.1 bifunctional phosphopantothenoylcysteine decarboxylase/phosphopantothenate--cysteine ligase CoaBC [Desulfolutivibrio sulfoxidireducens]
MDAHLCFTCYQGQRAHLGVTGSVAAYKALPLLRALVSTGMGVGATLTRAAARFVTPLSFQALGADPVHGEMFSPSEHVFDHLAPAHTSGCLVIAPATANFLAKMAHGLADDMLSCQALSFSGPKIVAPAMNPLLWEAPATRENRGVLLARGVTFAEPGCGDMACGDSGAGRLADERTIFSLVLQSLTPQDMNGLTVLISLGPTHEYFDAARYWSNPSTGLMGACLAMSAWLRGARVTVVMGPCGLWLPPGMDIVRVETARRMHAACLDVWPQCDVACMVAAVADFSPVPYERDGMKFKKDVSGTCAPEIRFTPNPDILFDLGRSKKAGQRLVGFCAETQELRANAEDKLRRKNCDLMVANPLGRADVGFGALQNEVSVVDADGRFEQWPSLPKTEVAWRIWDWMIRS